MSPEEELKSLACHHLQSVWIQDRPKEADENKNLLHEDIAGSRNPPTLCQMRHALNRACPDLTLTVEEAIVEGTRVALRWTLRGTDTQGYPGRLPTGKQITATGMQMVRFEEQHLVEMWEMADLLDVLSQLNFICTPAPPRITVRRFSS